MTDPQRPDDAPHPDLGGYVLGNLAPEEEAAFAALIESNPDLRRELAELADLPELLRLAGEVDGDGADDVVVPPAAGRHPVGAVVPLPRGRRFGVGALAAAAVAAALVVGIPAALVASRASDGPTIEQQLTLGPGKAPIAGAAGSAELFTEGNGVGVQLKLTGLARTGQGERYECWWVGKAGRVTAGSFQVGADGRADVRLTVAAALGNGAVLNINRISGETETNVLTVQT